MGEPGTGNWCRWWGLTGVTLALSSPLNQDAVNSCRCRPVGKGLLGLWDFVHHSTAWLVGQGAWQVEAWEERGVINVKSWEDAWTEQALCFTLVFSFFEHYPADG